jgi:amino acid adenylation domain-containing protein
MSITIFHDTTAQGDVTAFPLSLAQQGLWILEQLQPDNLRHILSASIRIQQSLNTQLLEQSLNRMIERHDALRTTFQVIEGQPLQVIAPTLTISFPMIDLQSFSHSQQQAKIQRLTREIQQPFDLSQGPLIRARLLQLAEQEYILLLSAHHLICDSRSLTIFLRELLNMYTALSNDQPAPLLEPALQYTDFVLHQQTWLEGSDAANQLNYWKQQLADSPASLDLPTDRPHTQSPKLQSSTYDLFLPCTLSRALRTLSQREQVGLDTILIAALQILLYRYSGQQDLLVGTIAEGRTSAESKTAIGLFENIVTLRTKLSDDLTFRELLQRVHKVIEQAMQHQELPFESLTQALHPSHTPGHNPFAQVMLTLTTPPTLSPAWTITQMDSGEASSLHDLSIAIENCSDELCARFTYNCDLFDEATIIKMAAHWQAILEAASTYLTTPLASIPLLSEQERNKLLVEWNTPQIEYFPGRCVHELFEMQVDSTPEAVAVVCEAQRLTYGELNQRANRLAHYLRQLGVQPEVPVGICVERSLDMIVGLLGILKAGGVHVPLDAALPAERLAFITQDANIPTVLTQQHLCAQFSTSHSRLVCLDTDEKRIDQQPTTNPIHTAKGTHLAYIIYTSGSTGQPKGVMIEHHALAAHCGAIIQAQELSANDRTLQFNAFNFDASLEQIFPPLLVGARLVLRGPDIWSPMDLLDHVKQHQLTVITMPCDYWHEVITEWMTMPDQIANLRLRLIIAGGDRFPPEAVQLWRQSPLRARLFNVYGPTEATITTTIYDIPRHVEPESPGMNIPIGRPLPNRTVYLLDKQGQPVPEGVAGELHIGGALLARGYLNRPELTTARFIPDPFSQQPQARLYKTGDLARYRAGGIIEFLGRVDQQVKIRGYRIELGEIEAAIKQHPDVQHVLVMAREDMPGIKRLVAYVVPHSVQESPQLATQLRNLLQEQLPDYMLPAAFVVLEAFPLNAGGKFDRRALPIPDLTDNERKEYFVAPRTPQEEIIAGIWEESLGIERISIHENFFALGGHSLLAMQIISRLQALFQVRIPLLRFFAAPTIVQLTEIITQLQTTSIQLSQPALQHNEQDQDRTIFPVSLTQEGLWFLQQVEPESVNYNIYVVLRIRASLDVATLERSINALVQRHDALRTTFGTREGQAVQIVAPTLSLTLPVLNLRHLPEQERNAEARRLASKEASKPFHLTEGPLLRALLLQLAQEESLLVLTMHHVIADGWSLNVLLPELNSLYTAFASGQPSPLPAVSLQHTDFALWQREMLREGHFAGQMAYWEQKLAHLPDALDLPITHPRPAQHTTRGATYLLTLPQTLTQQLQRLSRQQGVTPYMLLVAAFQTLLYRYTGQEDLVIGTVAANRQAETEAMVGFLVNTLVLRTDLSGNPRFTELLTRVREVVLEAQAHQELPFASLVKAIKPERQAGRNPLFQVMMSFDTPLARLSEDWEPLDLGNLTATAQFDLSLEVQQLQEQFTCRFEYSTDLFDEATIARLANHWQTLLSGIVAQPGQTLSTLPLLPEQEHRQLLIEWNATQRDYPLQRCLHEVFEAQVERTPDEVAVVCEGEQLTYRELNARANQFAHLLRKRGAGPEKLVALLSERGIPFLISMLAVFKAGAAYLPLDPHHPALRLRRVIEHSQCNIILASTPFASTLNNALETMPIEQRPELHYYETIEEALQPGHDEENLPTTNTPQSLAYVIYTSGSTGMPKGAMIEQRGMLNHLYAKIEALTLTEKDIIAQTASQCFDISVWQFLAALLVGGQVRIYPDEVAHNPVQLLMQIEQHHVSILETVPSLLRAMLNANEIKAANGPKLTALRWLVPTGEALAVDLCRRWLSIYPHVPLLNAYGPTECSDDVTHYPIYEAPDETRSSIPIGRAIPNMRLYVLDRRLQPLPMGASGELYVGGIGVGRGYLGDESRTKEAFIPDPFSSEVGARLYKTGDRARYLSDGNIEFQGRLDFQVKLRGFRIELGEIEAVLNQHPAVRHAVVMAREDTPGEQRLVAYVELQKERNTTVADLKNHVAAQVPAYMVPSAFLLLETLPLTPNGKINRRALPAPEVGSGTSTESYVPPRLPVEQQLVQIWEELLTARPIGIKDDFFELGGDSLLAVRLFDRIAQVCGKKLPLSTLFAGATIEHLAQAIMYEKKIDGRVPLVIVQEGGSRPPFFYLHGEWKGGGLYSRELARRQGPEQPFYLLEPYKFDGLTTLPTFEEMAAAHLEVMRRIQPEGPYFFSGYCNGALLAYEMARQMHAQGIEVGLVLLMDPDFPARHGAVRKAISNVCNLLHIGPEKQFEGFLCLQHIYRYLRFAHYRRTTNAALLQNIDGGKSNGKVSLALKLKALWPRVEILRHDWSNIYDWLVSNYMPDMYPGKLTFFWTSEEPKRSEGWQKVMEAKKGEVEVYMNPGNHISGRTEYLPVLAERLRHCLTKAQEAVKR